jgi:hypothetical protein
MPFNQGAAAARNKGFHYARGKYIVWLDADDFWTPWYLERMVSAAEKNNGVIDPDLIMLTPGQEYKIYRYGEFDCEKIPFGMLYPGSSVLFPRNIVEKILEFQGGWDVDMPGMEDWGYQIATHALGFCAYHVTEPLFVYRMYSSTKREVDHAKIKEIVDYVDKKWKPYRSGVTRMGCGCGPKTPPATLPESFLTSSGEFIHQGLAYQSTSAPEGQMIMVEYVGPLMESFSIRSRIVRDISYRFGNNEYDRQKAVLVQDFVFLTGLTDANGDPMYRAVGSGIPIDENNPADFVGHPINA